MKESNCSISEETIEPESRGGAQANNVGAASPKNILRAVELIRQGEVIGLPTETVYGLAADGLNPVALARIFEVKQRPLFDPLILHVLGAEEAWELAARVPDEARRLAEKFWPGPLTLILPKQDVVPDLATSGLPNVALRVPAHAVAREVLQRFGGPLAAPSANRFGRISPTDAEAVRAELGEAVLLILDGGACTVGMESTVLALSGERPMLLRAGGTGVEEIEAVIGAVERARPVDENPAGPGQLKHHYAPRKPLRLIASVAAIDRHDGVGILAFGPEGMSYAGSGVIENLSASGDLREAAANFFRTLRQLDDDPRVKIIYAVSMPKVDLGLAMQERLERAAHS